jgi:hypothetical protein
MLLLDLSCSVNAGVVGKHKSFGGKTEILMSFIKFA